jgi:hypothetical protein
MPSSSGLWREYSFTETLSEGSTSFLVVPYIETGFVRIESFRFGTTVVDIRSDYRHHNMPFDLLDKWPPAEIGEPFFELTMAWPVQVPYAPRFQSLVEPGARYEFLVSARNGSPCLYLLESQRGQQLRLNFYFANLGDLSASNAPSDDRFTAALVSLFEMLSVAGIYVDNVDFFNLAETDAVQNAILREPDDVTRITSLGRPRGDSLDDHLSIDIFVVQDIVFSSGSPLGISPAIPGAAGLHGARNNGIVVETVSLDSNPRLIGLTLAHEIGHFLGLRHTTEVLHGVDAPPVTTLDELVGTTDPIDDTPVCEDIAQNPEACPDRNNLMFPRVPASAEAYLLELTDGQVFVLQSNPLVR